MLRFEDKEKYKPRFYFIHNKQSTATKTTMKLILTLLLIVLFAQSYAQSWEVLNQDYTYVYDISKLDDKLCITGLKNEDFIFATSNDEGLTWNEIILNQNISVEQGLPISVGFFSEEEGIIGIKGNATQEYLKTADGGLTWESFVPDFISDVDNIPQPYDMVVINDSTAIISQFQSGNYIITFNSGETWEIENAFNTSWSPKFIAFNLNTFYNYDTKGLFKSSDGGSIWTTALDVNGISTYNMYDANIGFAVSEYFTDTNSIPTLYKTMDGWNAFDSNPLLALKEKIIVGMATISADEIFFFESQNIYYSSDAGNSVSFFQELDFEPVSVKKVNNEWYATGRGLAKFNPLGVVNNTDDNIEIQTLSIYPNPLENSKIRLSTNEFTSFELYTYNGKLIETGIINNSEIILHAAIKGLHILKVKNGVLQKTFKVLAE